MRPICRENVYNPGDRVLRSTANRGRQIEPLHWVETVDWANIGKRLRICASRYVRFYRWKGSADEVLSEGLSIDDLVGETIRVFIEVCRRRDAVPEPHFPFMVGTLRNKIDALARAGARRLETPFPEFWEPAQESDLAARIDAADSLDRIHRSVESAGDDGVKRFWDAVRRGFDPAKPGSFREELGMTRSEVYNVKRRLLKIIRPWMEEVRHEA